MYVCGQRTLISKIDTLVKSKSVPRFIILVGNEGFGKKVLSDYIARSIGANFVPCSIDIENIRDMISTANTVVDKTLYMLPDCDTMSINAKNAILKVTEEPPNDSYFVMTVRDISTVLDTLVSRGTVFTLEPYSKDDIQDFVDMRCNDIPESDIKKMKQLCICPKDVLLLRGRSLSDLYDMSDRFIQYIGQANIANELKIAAQLAVKKADVDNKIDPTLFLRCIMILCNAYITQPCSKEDEKIFHVIISETSKCLSEMCMKGCNKQIAIDNYIISTHMKVNGGAI